MILDLFGVSDTLSLEFDLPDGVPAGTFTASLLGPIYADTLLAIQAFAGTPVTMTVTPRAAVGSLPAGFTLSLAAPVPPYAPGIYAVDVKNANGAAVSHVKLPAFIRLRSAS